MKQNSENPFFGTYRTPFETPPFDQIETEHYEPAFDEGIRQLDEEVRAIADNAELPTFENTIVALERSGKLLDKVSSAFFNVLNAEADDEMMDISQRVSPKLSESSNNIYLNEKLFARVKSVYDQKEELHLPTEDARLLEETFDAFSVRGAALGPENKEKYRRLSSELSLLSLTFDQNALKDKNRYELLLTKENELEGLPESIREAAALRAKEKGKTGWLFNLSAPSYVPFMRYSALRGLREKMYREYMSVGNKGDEYDNKEIIRKIVNIRQEIANLMGHANYADYKLKHTMAKTPARVYKLLNELLEAYKPVAQSEYEAVQGFASVTEKENITVMPWDWSYYSEKLKDTRFNVNDEMTRPYFELNHVKKGVFGLATQLYGITFKENKEIPVYHPEVEAYEVYDADGKFLSILYTDFHPRDGKQSGAWMNSIKEQYRGEDKVMELMDAVDSYIPLPQRDNEKPFLMPVEDVFSITGRGTVLTGRIETGVIKVGDPVEIIGLAEKSLTSTCTGVEMFRKLLDEGEAGDNVGLLMRGIDKKEVKRGMVVAKPGSITPHTKFEAEVYILKKEEGGRHTPFHHKYRPQFYLRTLDVTGEVELPEGVEMVMPGDNVSITVTLIYPVALNVGLRFAIREGGRTVGAGQITKIIE